MSVWPAVVWVAEEKSPPVFDRFIETPEPDVTPDGDSLEGAVRNLKASFSVLKGTVIRAPESSPSDCEINPRRSSDAPTPNG